MKPCRKHKPFHQALACQVHITICLFSAIRCLTVLSSLSSKLESPYLKAPDASMIRGLHIPQVIAYIVPNPFQCVTRVMMELNYRIYILRILTCGKAIV